MPTAAGTGKVKRLKSNKNPIMYHTRGFSQPKVSTRIRIGQLCMIKAQQRQDGCVEIVNGHPILRSMVSEVIRRTVCEAGLHATARHESGVAVRILIASVDAF